MDRSGGAQANCSSFAGDGMSPEEEHNDKEGGTCDKDNTPLDFGRRVTRGVENGSGSGRRFGLASVRRRSLLHVWLLCLGLVVVRHSHRVPGAGAALSFLELATQVKAHAKVRERPREDAENIAGREGEDIRASDD